jgi:hypothetical protein
MDRNTLKIFAVTIVAVTTLGAPAVGSAQSNGSTRAVARCDAAHTRDVVYDEDGRASQVRPVSYQVSRPVARRSNVQYVERAPERSKTKSALMIAGAAATGAGVGGALKGTKGALIGAAVGGGAASIYEAAKRR